MDYDDGIYTSDSVQWQSSQTTCAALDSLLSEAAVKAQPGLFRKGRRDLASDATSSPTYPSKRVSRSSVSSSFTSNPTSPSVSSFTTTPGSSRSTSYNTTPSSASSSSGWEISSNDHRKRLSRPSPSTSVEAPPVFDPDQFLNMLKGVSERIDGNIRNDTNPRDTHKRKPSSKRIACSSDTGAKRIKCDSNSNSRDSSTPENAARRKTRDLGALACTSMNIPNLPNPTKTARVSRSLSVQLDDHGFAMDVDPPKPSSEVMPPPPVPPSKASASVSSLSAASYQSAFDSPLSKMSTTNTTTTPENFYAGPPPRPIIRSKDTGPTNSAAPRTPKLHPLLDPERKQRRLKLERTISASFGLFPSESPSTSKSPSTSVVSPAPVRQPQETPSHSNRQLPNTLPLSQGFSSGNPPRPPALGMRRTNTFPSSSQNPPKSNSTSKSGPSMKPKPFKPPLLSSSQPPSTPPTSSPSSKGKIPSSDQVSFKGSSPLIISTSPSSSRPSDEDMTDVLPSSSDGDISFGDALSFDVDMDALEETMRKYD